MATSIKQQIATNRRNTIILMVVFVAFIALIGALFTWLTGNKYLPLVFAVVAGGYALFQYFLADKLALTAASARQTNATDNPRLYKIVQQLADDAKLPTPRVYIINDSAPNAFATGRDPEHASVAATTGLLEIMDDQELRAVMGHEMSHVKNFDIRLNMIVFGLVALIGLFSDIGLRMLFYGGRDEEDRSPVGVLIAIVTLILSPIIASFVQLGISRQREYLADASSAKLTSDADGMIAALRKLEAHHRPMHQQNIASASMFITNPLRKSFLSKLFSTHPTIESRIERLENGKKS